MTTQNQNSIEQFAMTLDENKGPVCFPNPVDFRTASNTEIDLSQLTERGEISFISGVFLDNWNSAEEIRITCKGTNHTVTFPANSMGFIPLLCPNPPVFTIQASGAVGSFIVPIFYNTPIVPFIQVKPA